MKLRFFYILIGFLILESCARRGNPEGGELDVDPPVFESAQPNHETLHFKSEKIRIIFNEFIKLNNLNNQLVISPPMKYRPVISPVGSASKIINIKILDTLKENTTYTFNFGNSVEDNNEGNLLSNFKYIFSTGDYIDSLKVIGTVKDGFEKEVDANISVLLYEITEEFTDSIIYKEQPNYVGSTLDSINFELTNLKDGKYLMIALKDLNNNYKFDPKQDKIAFHSEFISLPTEETFELTLFKEILPFKLTRPSEIKKGHIYFGYEGDAKNIKIELISEKPTNFESRLSFEKGKDTVSYWFSPQLKDSMQFRVTNNDFEKNITVKLRSKEIDSLTISSEMGSTLSLRDTFSITTNIPIERIDKSKISITDKDSLNVLFTTLMDATKRTLKLNFDKTYNNKYQFKMLPGAIEDLFGNVNDSLKYNVTTKHPDDYGIIRLTLNNPKSHNIILDLVDEKGELIQREYTSQSRQFKFEFLAANNYMFRVIYDANNNGKWDSGNFLQKQVPEKVVHFNEKIELKANWIENTTINLK